MLLRHLRLLLMLPFLVLQSTPPAGDPSAGNPAAGDPPKNDPPASDPPLGESGERALRAERDARKDAESRAKTAEAELKKLKDAAQERADKEAEEQGEWQKLAGQREADLKAANESVTSLTAEVDQLSAYVRDDIATVHKQVTDAAKANGTAKVLLDFHPGDEAAIADLIAWTAKAKAQLPDLTAPAGKEGNTPNPKAGKDQIDIKQEAAKARARGTYRV